MGAGSYAFGLGPFGFDPVAPNTSRSTQPVVNPLYDPFTRDFPFAPGGDFIDVHPVIQEAMLALGVALGSIPSARKVGINKARIKATRSSDIPTVCREEATTALSRLVNAGDLRIVDVRAEAAQGRVGMDVDIVNLRDPDNVGRTVTLKGSY